MTLPSDLLFQVSFIRWIENPTFSFLLYSLFISCFIFIISRFFLKKGVNTRTQEDMLFPIMDISSSNFEEKCAIFLRRYLEKKYIPHHSTAHTSKDIYVYVRDKEIVEILRFLESSQYSGITIPFERRRVILDQINNFIKLK